MFQDPNRVTESPDEDAEAVVGAGKISSLIRRAVKNYDEMDGNKFSFTSSFYVSMLHNSIHATIKCKTCLAGSLVASKVLDNRSQIEFENLGNGSFRWTMQPHLDNFFNKNILSNDLEDVGVTEDDVTNMIVLEDIRKGNFAEAVVRFYNLSHNNPVRGVYENHPILKEVNREPIEWNSKKEWKESARVDFLRRADVLEAVGY